jgi:outer membrane protein insertion porin family
MNCKPYLILFLILFCSFLGTPVNLFSQKTVLQYGDVRELEIGGIEIKGVFYSDPNAIKSVTGLKVGDKIKIPGLAVTRAMRNLWKLRLFDNVEITQDKIIGDIVFLSIHLTERSRLAGWSYRGVPQSAHDELNDIITPFLIKGQVASTAMQINARNAMMKYYVEKGYLDVDIQIREEEASERTNAINLVFTIDTKAKIKIDRITFEGNEHVKDGKLAKLLKDTKAKAAFLKSSKFIETDYETDKLSLLAHYQNLGYRDARIAGDSIWRNEKGLVELLITIEEGKKYYFGNITWKGNTIHSSEELSRILGIQKGETYNEELLNTRLTFSIDGRDVSSIYLDDGYLFFSAEPTEVAVRGDTIDLEMRIFEGPQATIDEVVIKGNTLALGYFNPENLDIQTPVDQANGTVDIIYVVEERPSDQLELSAGWGGYGTSKIIGTLGVTFNNFSLRNIFNKDAWSPLPQGDGQRLSVRAQTNGDFFQSYNFSFTEPWLGGRKPNSFTLGGFITKYNQEIYNAGKLAISRGFIGLGSRLKWPDDNFVSNTTLNIEYLNLKDWTTGDFVEPGGGAITNGGYNNFSIQQTIARTTINEPNFPRSGSQISLSLQATLPYTTLFGRDYNPADPQDVYKWVEYHKWRIDAEWYTPVAGKLVLKTGAKMGYLGFYNKNIGAPPFERFEVGGDGLSNQQFGITGKDIIAMRGYEREDIPSNAQGGATIFNKFTAELRYPLSLNPNSTIFGLLFLEGGNAWKDFSDYNPFDLKRSVGVGLRAFLPMFGLIGFDFGYGFDNQAKIDTGAKWSEFGNFNIILGFEPD